MRSSINSMFSLVTTLSGIRRFSLIKLVHQENVLEHTGMVAIFAYLIGARINARMEGMIDMERLLRKAIVHDFDECVTGVVSFGKESYCACTAAVALGFLRQLRLDDDLP